ncbi:MAG: threonine synthase [Thermoplasmata archaeon]|nr:threonine synthase [Thermoplasmata archaeon]
MKDEVLRCIECGKEYSKNEILYSCQSCGNLLEVVIPLEDVDPVELRKKFDSRPLSVWRYHELLPRMRLSSPISMNEGGTPLHYCVNLGRQLGIDELYIKFDGMNPTGSFKDRGMTVGISKALDLGVKNVVCASTGNTSASLAAYAGLAGLKCIVMIPSGQIALGKLSQAMMHGAIVLAVKGNFDDALDLVVKSSKELGLYILNSINPFRPEGQKTAAFEICDQLKGAPDSLIIPVGNGGNSAAYWKGFSEYGMIGLIDGAPRIFGIQAEGAAPIAKAFEKGVEKIEPIKNPETVATAIKIGNPANWKKTIRAIKNSKGTSFTVTDEEIISAQKLVARTEGLFIEPAAASSVAGLIKLIGNEKIDRNERIVCVATGHGLKDPDSAIRASEKAIEIEPSIDALRRILSK